MSHKANYWLASLDPGRVKSGAFRVLFHLCDHHNGESDPKVACFPSQETLRERTGLSNGALNDALAAMELEGLLLRRRSTVPGGSERRTYYILGCDFGSATQLTPETGVSPNSSAPEIAEKLTPVSGQANSILGPSKLRCTGEEPVRTGKNQEEEEPDGSLSSDDDLPTVEVRGGATQDVVDALIAFNVAAAQSGWPQVRVLSKARRGALLARLRECGGLDGWRIALSKAQASPHLCGQNDRGWLASFDFITRQSSFAKIMEGNYDPRSSSPRSAAPNLRQDRPDPALEQIARLAGLGAAPGHDRR